MGQSNWLIAKTKKKQTMNLGSIPLIKKTNKLYGLKHVYPIFKTRIPKYIQLWVQVILHIFKVMNKA
jgi:hypothetical protein